MTQFSDVAWRRPEERRKLQLQFPASLPLTIYVAEVENSSWFGQAPSAAELEEALDVGQSGLRDRDKIEAIGPQLDANSPSYRHQMAVRTSAEATKLSRVGYVLDLATRHLVGRGMGRPQGSRETVGRGPTIEADWIPQNVCADIVTSCPPTPYRSADGSCNNRLHPSSWGVALRPFRRTLPPDYADGVSAPRVASNGDPLPSAREISIKVHRPMYRDDPNFTVMLAVWGQFIDHDITATALTKGKENFRSDILHCPKLLISGGDGSAISCCESGASHPECFPVQLAAGDPYFHQFNLTCMEFVRSASAPACNLGPREQLNQVSAFLDGSVVYGPNLNMTTELRSMQGGRLRMSLTPDGRTLLPYSSDPSDGCNQEQENARGRYCFASGDPRANENLHLTTMHLLWARQHNLIADRLAELNPSWDDERVFQEARRIVVAQLQHITYSEFLPVLLEKEYSPSLSTLIYGDGGMVDTPSSDQELAAAALSSSSNSDSSPPESSSSERAKKAQRLVFTVELAEAGGEIGMRRDEIMDHLDLSPQASGYFHGYNSSVDASIANSFASSAFRFGHTLLPGLMKMLGNGTEEYVELHRMLFNPYSLYTPGRLDDTLRGALDTQVEKVDPYFTKELTEHLFEQATSSAATGTTPCGLDLVSLNIQRGRDHGLPGYTAWRERCGLSRPRNFSDMIDYVDRASLWRMAELYRSVEDIDLYTGALAEKPLNGGFLGPTITCLLTDQFTRLKKGDRFWYETPEAPQAFTTDSFLLLPGQLQELRKSSLARIICDNADAVHHAQPQVMRSVGRDNERVPCSSLPAPNLALWQELPRLQLGQFTTAVRVMSSRFGGQVTAGQVITDAGTLLWEGRYPLAFPSTSSLRPLWSGKMTSDSLEGSFSLQLGTNMWLNGKFSFLLSVVWNQTALQQVSGTFNSPIYFKEVDMFEVPVSSTTVFNLSRELSPMPSVIAGPELPTAPLILEGMYSSNRNLFWWAGGIILTLPSSEYNGISTQIWTEITDKITPKKTEGNNITLRSSSLSFPWDENYNANQENTIESGNTFRGDVLSGAVTSNGENAIAWSNETFPLSIAIGPSSEYSLIEVYLAEIFWNGSMSSSSPDIVTLQGILSFQSTSSQLASIQDGFFSINMRVSPPLEHPVAGMFKSPIYFEQTPQMERLKLLTTEGTSLNLGKITSRSVESKYIEAPFTLSGTFTEDNSVFLWSGGISFTIPDTKLQSVIVTDSNESKSDESSVH
ncbi:hypothetical protein ANN_23214 [Periplaneta americana]|uniref:Peroxidase n=1 Tax=Periplaneta americana TaxID=6978 RepID=A0ABQ8SKH0_PERAM|nr:hypothetical protein ANN_23214 [Periplaneta americana]